MKQLSFLISFCVLAVVAGAQNQFLFYSFKGNVSVLDNNNVENKAKAGMPLNSAATVKIASGGSATLICNEAAMFTITKAGSYQLSKFGDSCKISSNSVSANYVKYVWAQMTKTGGSPGSDRKKYMSTVGAVSRGLSNVWVDPKLDTVNYSGGDFPLSWKSYADAKEFDFFLFKSSNIIEPFYTTTVTKLKIPIPSIQARMKAGESYRWIAAVKGEEAGEDRQVLNYVTKEIFNALLEKIKTQSPGVESPGAEAYRIAFMLEDAHYLSEAYQYYSKAATLDPTNVLYRSTLMSFRKDYEIK